MIASNIRFVSTVAPTLRIRGRAAEIAVLSQALDRAASGRLAIVLIEGEAGIGKSRLLAEALADARSRGVQVAASRAEELEQTRPFGLVASAFDCVRSSPDQRRAAIAESGMPSASVKAELRRPGTVEVNSSSTTTVSPGFNSTLSNG